MTVSPITAIASDPFYRTGATVSLPATTGAAPSFGEVFTQTTLGLGGAPLAADRPLTAAQREELLLYLQRQWYRTQSALLSDGGDGAENREEILAAPLLFDRPASSKNDHPDQNGDVRAAPGNLQPIIAEAARTEGVDPTLIRSVIKVESDFNPNSLSRSGAMGLMQLMPATARELGVQNAYDPVENVRAGTRYLKTLLDRYGGDVRLALAAYNWGMGNLERMPERMPAETRNYVDTVLRHCGRVQPPGTQV